MKFMHNKKIDETIEKILKYKKNSNSKTTCTSFKFVSFPLIIE